MFLFETPIYFAFIAILPALIAVAALLRFRNRNYIVAYDFNDHQCQLSLTYRGIKGNTLHDISIGYHDLIVRDFSEKKFFFNQAYKGKSISSTAHDVKLDFVTNNFIWEEQPKEKVRFLEEIERVKKLIEIR